PIVRALTQIAIVEGFGAIIRDVPVPPLEREIVEPIDGTALAHLSLGLFEAHARDEAGHRDEGGHKQMWEAARDLALDNPKIPSDVLMRMMSRRSGRERRRAFPELSSEMERMLQTMVTVLVVEVFAEGTFAWGRGLLSNPEVSAAPEEAGAMVSYIQSDESPHVEYLRTALSEVRARRLRTVSGETLSGARVVDGMLHGALRQITSDRRREQQEVVRANLAEAVTKAGAPASVMDDFAALDTEWAAPERTGFEPDARETANA
ncbi:MAG: hypothetical protein MJE66_20485, partial [Proteobacteria bacterium]|nr:hypothetical protein [Pseudomonadota bacterium]